MSAEPSRTNRNAAAASFGLALFFGLGLILSMHWPTDSKMSMRFIASPGLILSLVYGLTLLRANRTGNPTNLVETVVRRDGSSTWEQVAEEREEADTTEEAEAFRKELRFFLWIVGYVLACWLFGLVYGSAIFLASYLRFEARERWLVTLAATVFAYVFLWGLLGEVFRMRLLQGALF